MANYDEIMRRERLYQLEHGGKTPSEVAKERLDKLDKEADDAVKQFLDDHCGLVTRIVDGRPVYDGGEGTRNYFKDAFKKLLISTLEHMAADGSLRGMISSMGFAQETRYY